MAALLLAHGADIEAADNDGDTPLHEAASSGDTRLIRFLLEKNANPTFLNKKGQRPEELADDPNAKKIFHETGPADEDELQ